MCAAGKETDELIGRAVVALKGELASRLLRGERVALPVQLASWQQGDAPAAQQAQAQPQRMGGQAVQLHGARGACSPSQRLQLFGKEALELLLEVQLLDAHLGAAPGQQGAQQPAVPSRWLGAGGSSGSQQLSSGPWPGASPAAAATAIARGPAECTLLVLVSAATSLPLVPGQDGNPEPPTAFVAAKSARDVMYQLPAQAVTRVAPRGRHAVWSQLLKVSGCAKGGKRIVSQPGIGS